LQSWLIQRIAFPVSASHWTAATGLLGHTRHTKFDPVNEMVEHALPEITLLPGQDQRILRGHPWVFANEIAQSDAARALEPGTLVRLLDAKGRFLGTAGYNPKTHIAARILERDPALSVDRAWIAARLRRALELRGRVLDTRYCRLIHAEADGLPGLILDRYGDVIVAQPNAAVMERLWPAIEVSLQDLLAPRSILVAGDGAVRATEGLPADRRLIGDPLADPIAVEENGVTYLADLWTGQKTGWFYDQRDNRAFAASLSRDRSVLDVYSYTGGFALACARAGARSVVAVDGSKAALDLAQAAAVRNGLAPICEFRVAEAFGELARLGSAGTRFEVVITDPPAFAKSKKDIAPALKGYRKLARMAAQVTAPGGILIAASCSHHVGVDAFRAEVARGAWQAGRNARILREAGAAPDHPVHPMLPQSAYLKAIALVMD
jgi:23S rRNA (cytosine1962-C5)-methyltransferase